MYSIGGTPYSLDDPMLNDALAAVYGTPARPLCLCKPGGIEMYIAKVNNQHILKRMPHSGGKHAMSCESYEPPAELSGRGEVMDGAIQTDMAEGTTTLRFDFALSKSGTRAAPTKGNGESDSVRTDGKKLTLRGTLHYLYDEAGLSRWFPAMAGKRNWWIIRKALFGAASDKCAKGAQLADLLYIPESFSIEKKDEIAQRRLNLFRTLSPVETATRKLMLLVGELKEMGDARFGKKMVIKHLPDCHFMMNEDVYKRFLKRFESELSLWSGDETSHLLIVATFGVNGTGTASLEEASAMLVNEHWIPYESVDERLLIDALIQQKRRFVKGLRYNLPSSKVLARAVLNDTDEPVALYVTPYGADEGYTKQMQELIDSSDMVAWEWNTGERMPDLPPQAR